MSFYDEYMDAMNYMNKNFVYVPFGPGRYIFLYHDNVMMGGADPTYNVKVGLVDAQGKKHILGHIEPQNPTNFILNETEPPENL